jgi:hypothetical protein
MKLILFGASVFYLLGLKLTTQIHVKPAFLPKPTAIESKSFQENKAKSEEKLVTPEITVKDTTISATKLNQVNHKNDSKSTKFSSSGKGAV